MRANFEDVDEMLPDHNTGDPKRHFDHLNDEEWFPVWETARRVLANPTKQVEENLRFSVDDAALMSGYFWEFQAPSGLSRSIVREKLSKSRRYLEFAREFRRETVDMPGATSIYSEEFPQKRDIMSFHLFEVILELRQTIDSYEEQLPKLPNPSNAAKPERDLWMARLTIAWRDDCSLDIRNTVHLRRFLVAAMSPHLPSIDDRAAKHFLDRWNAGEVGEPAPSPQRLARLSGETDKLKSS